MKPYYQDDYVTLYHGDCHVILPEVVGAKVDAVITDPPYGVDWNTDYTRFTSGFDVPRTKHKAVEGDQKPFDPRFLLKYGRQVVTWGANCYSHHLPLGSWLVWDKRHANGKAFLADAEMAWWSKGFGVYIFSQTCQGCLRPERTQHPTQKTEALMQWCIQKTDTKKRKTETILDPFAGSGTTLRAAKDLGRHAVGVEIEEQYCEITARRLAQEVLPLEL